MIIIKEMIYGKFTKIIPVGCVFKKKVLNVPIQFLFFYVIDSKMKSELLQKSDIEASNMLIF